MDSSTGDVVSAIGETDWGCAFYILIIDLYALATNRNTMYLGGPAQATFTCVSRWQFCLYWLHCHFFPRNIASYLLYRICNLQLGQILLGVLEALTYWPLTSLLVGDNTGFSFSVIWIFRKNFILRGWRILLTWFLESLSEISLIYHVRFRLSIHASIDLLTRLLSFHILKAL